MTWAQDPNNYWKLGLYDLKFSTNPGAPVNVSSSQGSLASIADNNGNEVRNKNFALVNNGTIGYYAQMARIVPNPANDKQYYVFKADNYPVLDYEGGFYGPYFTYSIVEFNSTYLLGTLVEINPTAQESVTEYNKYTKALTYSLGNFRNTWDYNAITVTKNNDGTAYWVIIQYQNKMLSYKIDGSGLNPVSVGLLPMPKSTRRDH